MTKSMVEIVVISANITIHVVTWTNVGFGFVNCDDWWRKDGKLRQTHCK